MKLSGNTILITGGGSGIGRGLAEAFHAAGSRVVIAGRRRGPLAETAAANPGMAFEEIDVGDAGAIRDFAARVVRTYPSLNALVNNAGVMRTEDMAAEPIDLATCEETIATNLLAPIRLSAALLPHLRAQPVATIVNVSSGLAFVPRADTPTYSATKAAIHSYTQSLRFQLRKTSVQVIELAPPLVATDLTPGQRENARAMPLDAFIGESMALLRDNPAAGEILVERVKMQREAESKGEHAKVFGLINPD